MFKRHKDYEISQLLRLLIAFSVSYFSPIIGLVLIVYSKLKKTLLPYAKVSTLGICGALLFYTVNYLTFVRWKR